MRSLVLAGAMTAGLAIGACGSDGSDRPVPRIQHAVIDVSIREYAIDYEQPVPDGRVVFRVVNDGRQIHRLTMLELPEDLPPIAEQLRGSSRRSVPPLAGLPGMRPGDRNSFAVDLVRGRRYGMIDPTGDVSGRSNAALGLNTEFRAGGGRPGPKAAGTGARTQPQRKSDQGPEPGRTRARPTRRPARRPSPSARRPSRPTRPAAPDAGLNPAAPANAGADGQAGPP